MVPSSDCRSSRKVDTASWQVEEVSIHVVFKLEVILDLALVPTDVFKLADYGIAIPQHA